MEQCQICKQVLEVLTEYHCSQHGITKDEYREKYGTVKVKNYFKILKKAEYNEADLYKMGKCKRQR